MKFKTAVSIYRKGSQSSVAAYMTAGQVCMERCLWRQYTAPDIRGLFHINIRCILKHIQGLTRLTFFPINAVLQMGICPRSQLYNNDTSRWNFRTYPFVD